MFPVKGKLIKSVSTVDNSKKVSSLVSLRMVVAVTRQTSPGEQKYLQSCYLLLVCLGSMFCTYSSCITRLGIETVKN